MTVTPVTTRSNFRHGMSANTACRQHGLTLIEVMVAITISLIMLAGVIQLFVSNKQAYRIQESINSLQENGRFGLQFVSASLRMADNWGGIKASGITGAPSSTGITGIGSCNASWITAVTNGFQGYTGLGASTNQLPANCIAAADYVSGSDLFVVRYADANFVKTAALTAANFYIRSAVGHRAALFLGSGVGSLPADIYDSANPDAVGFFNYAYATELYFIRPCSAPAGANCTASDDGGNPIPTLVKYSLNNNTWTGPQALAEGVETMKLEYGIASAAANTDTAQYVDANTAATNGWNLVRSVRVTLVVRANERDVGYSDTTPYKLPDGTTAGTTYTPAGAVQNYRRKVFTTVVQIRNRSRS